MTKREALVHLVSGFLAGTTSTIGIVQGAEDLLAEIERVCPEECEGPPQSKVTRAEARRQVEVEREACAKVAEGYFASTTFESTSVVREEIAAAIRARGAK